MTNVYAQSPFSNTRNFYKRAHQIIIFTDLIQRENIKFVILWGLFVLLGIRRPKYWKTLNMLHMSAQETIVDSSIMEKQVKVRIFGHWPKI